MVLHEKFPQPFGRNVGLDHGGVKSLARVLDSVLVDVSREHLDAGWIIETSSVIIQEHCYGVRFLTGGAARYPHAHFVIVLFAGEELRNMRFEHGERLP